MARAFTLLFLLGAAALAVLTLLWPGAVAVRESLSAADLFEALPGPRGLQLIARGLLVSAGAAAISLALGALLSPALGQRGRLRAFVLWTLLVTLLTPPYLYAYAWSFPLLPEGITIGAPGAAVSPGWLASTARAIWCLGTWSAPVAAGILWAGWRTTGRHAYLLSLLDARPFSAVSRGALPAMVPWLIIAFLMSFLLGSTEFSVCHLCLVQTWNTEVLAAAQNLESPGEAFLLAWPLLVIHVGMLLLLLPFRRHVRLLFQVLGEWQESGHSSADDRARTPRWSKAGPLFACMLLLLPWPLYLSYIRDIGGFARTWQTYSEEWPDGLLCAAGAATVAGWLAVSVDFCLSAPRRGPLRAARWGAGLVLAVAALAAISPPALVGDAFAAAFIRHAVISNHWPIMSLVTAARFAVVAILVLRLAERSVPSSLGALAATDGAGHTSAYFRVRLPATWLPLMLGLGVVGLLAFTELAATSLVRVPGFDSLALTLLNNIHYGRDDQTIAMALNLMILVGALVAASQWILARRGRPGRRNARD